MATRVQAGGMHRNVLNPGLALCKDDKYHPSLYVVTFVVLYVSKPIPSF